jgi:hypothetical protein
VRSQDILFIQRTRRAADPRNCFLLQQCFDGDVADAKAAWNEYVLRYVDGRPGADRLKRRVKPSPREFGAS